MVEEDPWEIRIPRVENVVNEDEVFGDGRPPPSEIVKLNPASSSSFHVIAILRHVCLHVYTMAFQLSVQTLEN